MSIIKELFKPVSNRNHVGKANHKRGYLILWSAVTVVAIIFVIIEPSVWPLAVGAVVIGIINYFTFDKWTDNVLWKMFRKSYPSQRDPTIKHQAMQDFDKNPSEDNADKLSTKS